MTGLTFGQAIEQMKQGKKLASQTDMISDDWEVVE